MVLAACMVTNVFHHIFFFFYAVVFLFFSKTVFHDQGSQYAVVLACMENYEYLQ